MKQPKYKMNKRGNIVADIALFAIIAFVVLALLYVVNHFWSTTYSDILDDPDLNTGTINETYQSMDGWVSSLGFIFFFMIGGIILFLVLSSQQIDTHPGFYILAFFALIIIIIIGANISNAFNDFADDSSFTEQKQDFNLANNVVLYLPIFILLMGGIVLIILYAKP